MRHLTEEFNEESHTEATVATLKVKFKANKEVMKNNLINSCKSEENDTSKRQKGKIK